jgi:hypothetical protein
VAGWLVGWLASEGVIKWLAIFLPSRRHRVKMNQSYFKWKPFIISGIHNPQGSRSGPLQFIIYKNDLVDTCAEGSVLYLYAYYAKLFRRISIDDDIILQKDLDMDRCGAITSKCNLV